MSAGRSKQPSKQQIKTHRTSIKNQSVRIIEDKKQLNFE